MIIDGNEWREFAVQYDTDDGLFETKIWALDTGHAAMCLDDLKRTGKITGEVVHVEPF